MAVVDIELGARRYQIDCADAQQARLTRLAEIVTDRARALEESGAAARTPEGEDPSLRFLLLTALLVADQLAKTEDAMARLESQADQPAADAAEAPVQNSPDAAAPAPRGADEPVDMAREPAGDAEPTLDPEIEAALAALIDSAAERLDAAAEALERA